MSDLQQRNYYKIFTGTNQTKGYDKLHLGYEATTTEITLKKDDTTFFHVPFFANSQTLSDSNLIGDGAVFGAIPALADRIFKKQADYANTTPWGKSTIQDGTWLCSWLYGDENSGISPTWYDRYYNPGAIDYTTALQQGISIYNNNDPIYIDIPSQLTLEPGVLYQYYHNGEQSAQQAVKTFAGDDNSRLRLSIDNWSSTTVDTSIYNNTVTINNFQNNWTIAPFSDPGYTDRNVLTFDNSDFINAKIDYNDSYALLNEFTLTFWVYNKSWKNATSTQLIGNYNRGGYGVFYNNLNYNPYYVIPENTYGHLIYFNQDNSNYYDQNIGFSTKQTANPVCVNINSNSEIVVLDAKNSLITKYDHQGNVLSYCTDLSGNVLYIPGDPKLLKIDGENNVIAVTTIGTYIFDQSLTLINTTTTSYTSGMQIVFDTYGTLQYVYNCNAAIYDSNNNLWTIGIDGNLYLTKNGVQTFYLNTSTATNADFNLAIDPENNLWVLNDSLTIVKINLTTGNISRVYVGTNRNDTKNISFINTYNRKTNTFTWYGLIYFSNEKTLYKINLAGDTLQTLSLTNNINILNVLTAEQNNDLLTFTGKGDFTGYEWRRIFNNILYKNKPQIQFIVSTKTNSKTLNSKYYTYKLSVPVQYLADAAWHLVTATFKQNTLSVYIDNYLRDTLSLPSSTVLNYNFKNNLYIGTPAGRNDNLNNELNTYSVIWNGAVDTIRLYDYALDSKFIKYFIREKTIASDIIWNVVTTPLQYVESIDRFFKHKLPGSKSNFFNIRISGTQITDPNTRLLIENSIIQLVQKTKPAYTELLNVEWID